jgi:sulfate permease, SulP family
MPHQGYLRSLRCGHALREAWREGYGLAQLRRDLLAGVTLGVIAVPLAMALAIASGVAPQYGLYTAVIAGFVIALSGGSRYSISGPTAAFVVILAPITHQWGLAGLLLATSMAGVLLVLMALLRLGRLIEYVPEPVTLGFTGGIALVIAGLQLRDLLGLPGGEASGHFLPRLLDSLQQLPATQLPSLAVASATLAVLLLWPRLKTPVPPHLPALLVGAGLCWLLQTQGYPQDTLGSRFEYLWAGETRPGIPPFLPEFVWPWLQPGPQGQPLELSWQLLRDLLPSAFAIAWLGAIESLLCALVLDGMTGTRHSANSELLGQGLGNLLAPLWGGIAATAALARSAANVKAGAFSPVAAMVHSLVVLVGFVVLADALAFLPMSALAALLLVVAWNMSEAPKLLQLWRRAGRADRAVLASCLLLTLAFDMVIAITAGILLAALLFMKEMAAMTRVLDKSPTQAAHLPAGWRLYSITGPLFFAAADRVFAELASRCHGQAGMILSWDGVSLLDAGGVSALERFMAQAQRQGCSLVFCDLAAQPLLALAKAGIHPQAGWRLEVNLARALDSLTGPPGAVAADLRAVSENQV